VETAGQAMDVKTPPLPEPRADHEVDLLALHRQEIVMVAKGAVGVELHHHDPVGIEVSLHGPEGLENLAHRIENPRINEEVSARLLGRLVLLEARVVDHLLSPALQHLPLGRVLRYLGQWLILGIVKNSSREHAMGRRMDVTNHT